MILFCLEKLSYTKLTLSNVLSQGLEEMEVLLKWLFSLDVIDITVQLPFPSKF